MSIPISVVDAIVAAVSEQPDAEINDLLDATYDNLLDDDAIVWLDANKAETRRAIRRAVA